MAMNVISSEENVIDYYIHFAELLKVTQSTAQKLYMI